VRACEVHGEIARKSGDQLRGRPLHRLIAPISSRNGY
jgi:hypothetical protein